MLIKFTTEFLWPFTENILLQQLGGHRNCKHPEENVQTSEKPFPHVSRLFQFGFFSLNFTIMEYWIIENKGV